MTDVAVVVTARDEAARLPATLAALRGAFPGAELVVADDHSRDGTPDVARAGGARVERAPVPLGKGGAATLACARLAARAPDVVVLADADLGASAAELPRLATVVAGGKADLAVAAFAVRDGGGVGAAVGSARRMIRALTGRELRAPLSGQRAVHGAALARLLPFADGFGMEVGMTVDALRAGMRVEEVELPLGHRASGRTPAGFGHRGRQLRDVLAAYLARRSAAASPPG